MQALNLRLRGLTSLLLLFISAPEGPSGVEKETDRTEPPPALLRNKGSDLEVDNLALEGVAPELAPSDFVSQNYETLATLIKLPRRSIDGFEELRRAFRLNFTQRKKCAKNPIELARVKQRQGESMSAYVERYKDECIHIKGVPQTFDELMKHTRSFIQGEAAAADSKKIYSNYKSQEQPRRQSNDQSSNRNNSYRNQRGGQGNDKYTPLTKTPKEILATEGANFLKPPPMHTLEERRVGNRLDHLVKNIKEGKDKQKSRVVEPLTIEINGGGHDIYCMCIDGGASANILYEHCFQRLRPKVKSQLNPATMSLTGFTGEKIWPIGKIRLLVIVGNEEHSMTTSMTFMVIRSPLPYNGIIGRPRISVIHAVPSTAHGVLKFPVDGGIVTIYNTTVLPRECNTAACDATQTQTQHAAKVINLKVAIHPDYPEQEVSIGVHDWCATLDHRTQAKNLTRILLSTAEKARASSERAKAILEEVHKLVDAGIMREVYYHDWLSNPMMVKKSDGSWRIEVLLIERNSVQTPVYLVSKALKKTEVNYSAMEKLVFALVFAAKRLRRYFQVHPIVVITDQPIKQVISKPDASRRLKKWSVLLGEHNISYKPRIEVKGQILAGFIIEKPDTDVAPPWSKVKLHEPWILFTNISSCVDESGAGLILTNPEGMEFTYALRFEFTATNNEAEYEALIAGLRIVTRMGVRNLEANVDSRLVANHVLGEYVAKEDNMVQYLDKTKSLIQGFDRFTIKQADYVLREIHVGSCSMHSGPRSIVARSLRSGYYWPTMHHDAHLDLLEERRERVAICEAKSKSKMKRYYDAKVRGVSFRPGDFVYRANGPSHAKDVGKLKPKWEGPYEVSEALGNGAYKLRDMDGHELPRTWNICNLKRCYL
nr:reverse transcriptase domain-containing protein [Tanacetum cinerariifolium]